MTKVLYNTDWGGYCLPEEVLKRYCELSGQAGYVVDYDTNYCYDDNIPRHDPFLVQAFEEYIEGHKDEFPETDIAIWEIKGNKYFIREYDGLEQVCEPEDIHWIEVK